jgi:hypothetical protein
MKKLVILSTAIFLFACKNEKKATSADNDKTVTGEAPAPPPTENAVADYTPATNITYLADGIEIKNSASVLVTKDKDKLKAGAPYLCMLTSNAAKNNNEYLTLNFLLDTKPGTYPVVGTSFQRGKDPNNEMYGGLLGGKPKLTDYSVTITECKDLGSNNMGGHKWSISGTWEGIGIKAMGIMLMDKTKAHPAEVKLEKGSFTNLTFDDNWDEMLEQGLKQLKEKAK